MPQFPIIDAHVHLWEPDILRIPWLDHAPPILNRAILPETYQEETKEYQIEAYVYLEVDAAPHYTLLEAKQVVKYAQQDPRLQAIVAAAPLEYGKQVQTYLQELKQISPLIKGVRSLIQERGDSRFCTQTNFIEGARLVGENGLSLDMGIVHTQLAAVVELARQCPQTNIIVDHIGKPDIRAQQLDPWREHIQQLAALPNTWCKVSGLVTEADHQNWKLDDLAPYIHHVLDSFSEDRVVFGSDWPVERLAGTYTQWINALEQHTTHLSYKAQRKLWADNARKFYRIG